MSVNVGGLIAASHAKKLDCPICQTECQPEIIERETRSGDHHERLICQVWNQSFRRVWIGGYR